MCGGSPDIDTTYQDFQMDEANRSRAEEEARKARIEEGMKQIAAVFEGGTYAAPLDGYEAFKVDPGDPPEGTSPWEVSNYVNEQQWLEENSGKWDYTRPSEFGEEKTYDGMAPLLEQREQAQRDFYMPQLDKQRGNAQEDLTFALARAGLLSSSTAGKRQADLSEQFALERGSTLSRIASDIAGQQTRINQQRNSVEAGLRASGDQSAAANQALQAATAFRQDQPQLDPLGNLFYGVSQGIGATRQGEEVNRIKQLSQSPISSGSSGRLVR